MRIFTRLILVFILLGLIAANFLFYARPRYVVPILMYHYFNPQADGRDPLLMRPDTFERQMAFLKRHGYNVVPLQSLASMIRENKKIPPRTIAITIDDGYKSVFTYAFPILKKYRLPATAFVIVKEVRRPDHLSWEDMKEMRDSGLIAIGSHCLGAEPLVNIRSRDALKKEIFDSKRIIEEKLGCKVEAFSYPEGMFDPGIRKLVIEAGYKVAVATKPGRDYPDNDVFALKRLRISENTRNMFVFAAEASGFYTALKENKGHRHHGKK